MPLDKQIISLPIAAGMDTKSDPFVVQPGAGYLDALNCRLKHPGRAQKRNGDVVYDSDVIDIDYGEISDIYSIIENNNRINAFAEFRIEKWTDKYQYKDLITSTNQDMAHLPIGAHDATKLETYKIGRSYDHQGAVGHPDCAYNSANNTICYVWGNGKIYVTIVNAGDGTSIIDSVELSPVFATHAGRSPRVVAIGNSFLIFVGIQADNTLAVYSISATAPELPKSLPDDTVNDLDSIAKINAVAGQYTGDAKPVDAAIVCYLTDDSGTKKPVIRWYSAAAARLADTSITAADCAVTCLGFDRVYNTIYDAYQLLISWQDIGYTKINYAIITEAGVSYRGVTTIDDTLNAADRVYEISGCTASKYDYSTLRHFVLLYGVYTDDTLLYYDAFVRVAIDRYNSTVPNLKSYSLPRVDLVSKVFDHGGSFYFWARYDSYYETTADGAVLDGLQNCYMLLRQDYDKIWDTSGTAMQYPHVVARMYYGTAGSVPTTPDQLATVIDLGDDQYHTVMTRRTVEVREESGSNFFIHQPVGVTADLGDKALLSTQIGDGVLVTGGALRLIDGWCTENGWPFYPEHIGLEDGGDAGGALVDGDYYYMGIYEWVDRLGQLHRSAPSPPVKITMSGGTNAQVVDITVPIMPYISGRKISSARLVLYRGLLNSSAAFYRLTTLNLADYASWDIPVLTFSDTYSDTDIEDNEQPYTTWGASGSGGVVEAICPGTSNIIWSSGDRVFVVQDEDKKSVWYSKIKSDGLAVEFSDLYQIRFDDFGDIVAGIDMDGKQIVFSSDGICVFAGAGPNDTGIGSFSQVETVASDIGCSNPASVVLTGRGVVFQSAKGIYLLNRSMQVEYIGAPVEAYNGSDALCATVVPNANEVRIGMSDGTLLVWDYYVNAWTRDTERAPTSSCLHGGNYAYVCVGIAEESSTSYTKTHGTSVYEYEMSIVTPWIKISAMQGYQRCWWVYVLGTYKSPHQLEVKLAYDYDSTYTDTQTFDFTAAPTDGIVQARVMPSQQACESIKACVTIKKLADVALDEGATLNAIDFHIGAKRGGHLAPVARSK